MLGETEEEKDGMMSRWKEAMERAHNKEGEMEPANEKKWRLKADQLVRDMKIMDKAFKARIKELEDENTRLRKALEEITAMEAEEDDDELTIEEMADNFIWALSIATEALKEE